LCALALATGAVGAQRAAATGSISGTVQDADGNPIPDVEISAGLLARTIRSDTAGKFLFANVPAGPLELKLRRLAFAPASVMVEVEPKDTIGVTVTLTVVAQVLNAVVVQEDAARVRLMRQFEDRRKAGFGSFITRRQIEERNPRLLSDMVRLVPGAVLSPVASSAGRSVLHFSRAVVSPARTCEPQYWIDGIMAYGFNIDDILPSDVEGVELYQGVSITPPQFNNPRSNVACGTVVIWTRVPGD